MNITRRHFLRDCQLGLGGLALSLLAGRKVDRRSRAEPTTRWRRGRRISRPR